MPPAPPWTSPLYHDHPLSGRIWSPGDNRFLTSAELSQRMAAAPFVLLGEKHDNADHHRLQAWAVGRLAAAGRHPAVAFEMVDTTQGPTLSAYVKDHPGDVSGLGAALNWERSGWPDWGDNYQPVAEAALAANMPLVPANIPPKQIRPLARGEIATTAVTERVDFTTPLPEPLAQRMVEDIRSSHCNLLPERALPGMVRVQRARDALMALALVDGAALANADGAVLIAGAGHVRTDLGVPRVLAEVAPRRAAFALAFVEVIDGEPDPTAYAHSFDADRLPFDAVWFTPRVDDDDPCDKLR